jgi:hypothetical protein
MTEPSRLHEQAMDLAEEAFAAQHRGDAESAQYFFVQALALEVEAASAFPAILASEPTRSILYRSAATLAYHAGADDQAGALIAAALNGSPLMEIRAELGSLLDNINRRRTQMPADSWIDDSGTP